jgi:hypothetical protein
MPDWYKKYYVIVFGYDENTSIAFKADEKGFGTVLI